MPPGLTFLRPTSLDEAVGQLAEYDGDARVVAGSTALTIMLRQRLIDPAALVLLRGVPGLDSIERENGHVRVGALVTHRAAERSAELASAIPVLAETSGRVANVRVRNQATVGGVLAEADYASDPPAVFVGLGAEIDVHGPTGSRTVPAGEFFRAFYETALEPVEILTSVRVPVPAAGTAAVYKKYVSRCPRIGRASASSPPRARTASGWWWAQPPRRRRRFRRSRRSPPAGSMPRRSRRSPGATPSRSTRWTTCAAPRGTGRR
jgi:CO/xanthine dehydrogenase FAD-binding subunit